MEENNIYIRSALTMVDYILRQTDKKKYIHCVCVCVCVCIYIFECVYTMYLGSRFFWHILLKMTDTDLVFGFLFSLSCCQMRCSNCGCW